ncbi:hypothetical protein [Bremerella cremea]|uniref:hypothetical protein n=1 Tax=Bremerella cremea TaxID=1031537 RepID=UPI0011C058C1|nr:hypothetical protein [Bremerella cremea]
MYAACLLITSAVLGVDYGYQVTDQGQLEYVVQIEPEAIDSLKAGHPIQVGLPPGSERIQVFRVQVGTDELSKVVPASYQKPVKEIEPELKLQPANNAILTAPPDPDDIANTKPTLNDEALAQYVPRSTYELPSGASSSGTGANTSTSANGEIPGAAARYGGSPSSNFSVPTPSGTSRSGYSAAQTSATAPVTGSTSGTGGNGTQGNGTPRSSFTNSPTSASPSGNPQGSTASPSSNNYSNWNNTTSPTSSTPNSTTGNTGGAAATGPPSNALRFNQEQSPSTTAGTTQPEQISPSAGGWRAETNTNLGGNSSSYGQTGLQNGGSSLGNQPGSNTAPPLMTGGTNYTGNNNPLSLPNPPSNSGATNPDNTWQSGMWNNSGQANTSQPTSNPQQQYPQQQPVQNQNAPIYNNQPPQQQQPIYGNNYNNGYVNNPPYQQPQGQYNTPGYPNNPNIPASYQNPFYNNPQVPYLAANTPPYAMQAQNTVPTSQQNNNPPASQKEEDEEKTAKTPPPEVEIVHEPPDWWQLLAVCFLISICLNGYMFMTSQDFRRKYQDLLEDVRDLRSLSND